MAQFPALAAALGLPVLLALHRLLRSPRRPKLIPSNQERVLVIGGSSGIGRSIAEQYVARGARVCVTGRRADELATLEQECRAIRARNIPGGSKDLDQWVFTVTADFTNAQDMVGVREKLESAWGGVDTVIVSAGVSALRPVMEIAGNENGQLSTAEVEKTAKTADIAQQGNYIGPLVSAVTFIPLLQSSSPAPSILLVSSLGAVIPAPTRALYGSTKAAGLLLYQALSIEHPKIKFTLVLPSTVEGNFRASAVDGGPVREADPNKTGLKKDVVAARCISGVDKGDKFIFMPGFMRVAQLVYWIHPPLLERFASRKYNFTPH
ncbi:NAD-P-binding protein [Panus rudis PR-1116 ss-1]|nr:NAD-P-binding protein [Panus rudis PR-1116 ss-1]